MKIIVLTGKFRIKMIDLGDVNIFIPRRIIKGSRRAFISIIYF
jgi:hypothetical protein